MDSSRDAGVYGQLDPAIRDVNEIEFETSLDRWKVAATIESLVPETFDLGLHSHAGVRSEPLRPGLWHLQTPRVNTSSIAVTRYKGVARNLWASATAEFHLWTDMNVRSFYSENLSLDARLMYSPGDTYFWLRQQRDFVSSDDYETRDTWRTQAGFSRSLSDDEQVGVMVVRTEYPFESWGTAMSISAFATKTTPLGPIKGWIAARQIGDRTGLSGAFAFETEF